MGGTNRICRWLPALAERTIYKNEDRIKRSAHHAKGAVKKAVGRSAGDGKLEAEGKAEKEAGKLQDAVGGLKLTLRGK